MKRREFIVGLGGAAAWPMVVRAQQAMPVVGFLRDGRMDSSQHLINPFRKGLAEAGFIDGKNVSIEYALTGGKRERLSELTAALIRRPASVIVTSAIQATLAAKAATRPPRRRVSRCRRTCSPALTR